MNVTEQRQILLDVKLKNQSFERDLKKANATLEEFLNFEAKGEDVNDRFGASMQALSSILDSLRSSYIILLNNQKEYVQSGGKAADVMNRYDASLKGTENSIRTVAREMASMAQTELLATTGFEDMREAADGTSSAMENVTTISKTMMGNLRSSLGIVTNLFGNLGVSVSNVSDIFRSFLQGGVTGLTLGLLNLVGKLPMVRDFFNNVIQHTDDTQNAMVDLNDTITKVVHNIKEMMDNYNREVVAKTNVATQQQIATNKKAIDSLKELADTWNMVNSRVLDGYQIRQEFNKMSPQTIKYIEQHTKATEGWRAAWQRLAETSGQAVASLEHTNTALNKTLMSTSKYYDGATQKVEKFHHELRKGKEIVDEYDDTWEKIYEKIDELDLKLTRSQQKHLQGLVKTKGDYVKWLEDLRKEHDEAIKKAEQEFEEFNKKLSDEELAQVREMLSHGRDIDEVLNEILARREKVLAKTVEESKKMWAQMTEDAYQEQREREKRIEDSIKAFGTQTSAYVDIYLQRINDNIIKSQEALEASYAKGNVSYADYLNEKNNITRRAEEKRKGWIIAQAIIDRSNTIYSIAMDTSRAIMAEVAKFPPLGLPWSAVTAAFSAAKVAQVIATPLPKASKGGEVGGEPHSRGGTPIEAEKGEYIVSQLAYKNNKSIVNAINNGLNFDQLVKKNQSQTEKLIKEIRNIKVTASVEAFQTAAREYMQITNNV